MIKNNLVQNPCFVKEKRNIGHHDFGTGLYLGSQGFWWNGAEGEPFKNLSHVKIKSLISKT